MAEVEMTLKRAVAAEKLLREDLERAGPEAEAVYVTRDVLAYVTLARKALEQEAKPVPLGEVTEEHTLAALNATSPTEPTSVGVTERVAKLLATREQAAYERGKAERDLGGRGGTVIACDLSSEATIANAQTLADSAERERLRGLEDAVRRVGALLEANGCDCECGHHPDDHDEECTRCLACLIERTLRVQLRDAERLVRP